MSAAALLERLAASGGTALVGDDGEVRIRAPRGAVTAELVDQLRQHKAELLGALRPRVRTAACRGCGRFSFLEPAPLCWWCTHPSTPAPPVTAEVRRSTGKRAAGVVKVSTPMIPKGVCATRAGEPRAHDLEKHAGPPWPFGSR